MGDGRLPQEATVKIEVPAGVHEGSYMTMRGEGNSGKRGGQAGSIIVVFQEESHEFFTREDDNIIYELYISFPLAALGGEVEVPTLNGKAMLKIESGTQPGKMLKMSHKGIRHLNSSGSGDQFVRVNIVVPKKINSEEKELLNKLAGMPNLKSSTKGGDKGFFK